MDKPKLPGGYELLEQAGNIVLAFCEEGTLSRYATWLLDCHGETCCGCYFPEPLAAAKNFRRRAGL